MWFPDLGKFPNAFKFCRLRQLNCPFWTVTVWGYSPRQANIARRHLTQEEKREVIRKCLVETPEKSDRQIAAGIGVSQPTVSKIRSDMEDSGKLIKVISSIGADGKERPRQA